MEQDVWEKTIIHMMITNGWLLDKDDENILGFSRKDGEFLSLQDFDKKTRQFSHIANANRVINLVQKCADG